MNRREEPINARAKKKMKKIVRIAVETEEAPLPRNFRGQNPAAKPKKQTSQESSRVNALKKSLSIKMKKGLPGHKKRSSPGDVPGKPSPPSYPHKEGKRWLQTVEKQNLARAKQMTKRMAKKRSK